MLNIRKYKDAIAMLYDDRMDIYRYYKTSTGGSGGDITELDMDNPVATDVKCRLSFYSNMDTKQSNATTASAVDLYYAPRVFCSPDVDIRAGDQVVVHRNLFTEEQQDYKGRAGEPRSYGSHKQVTIITEDKA